MTLARIAAAVGARLPQAAGPDAVFTRLGIDSRAVQPGELFLCLPGERFDGHDYAALAAAAGAGAFIAQRDLPGVAAPVLRVADCRKALLELARAWRMEFRGRVAAVTGTSGKTTIKELLAQVLSGQMRVAKTARNYNNQVGLPQTILAADGREDAWVLELGISQPHDMAELAPVAAPDVAVIHNVGACHLQGLGSVAGVARAKAELLRHVRPGGTALANIDYPELWAAAQQAFPAVKAISTKNPDVAYFCAYLGTAQAGEGLSEDGLPVASPAGGVFLLRLQDERLELRLPFAGAHFAENVVAVAAAAYELGMAPGAIAEALAAAELPQQRFEARRLGAGLLIDDSYNANPLSMAGAVQAAAATAAGRGLVLVLGDMLELGGAAAAEHEALGRVIAAEGAGVGAVFYRGAHAGDVRRGLAAGGYAGRFAEVPTPEGLAALLADGLPGRVVLVKGSRGSRMEEFIPALEAALCVQATGGAAA